MVHFKSLAWATLVLPIAFGAVIAPREPSRAKAPAAVDPLAVVDISTGKLTNGERLARGLGLKTPTRRSTAAKTKQSGNPNYQAENNDEDLFLGPFVIRLKKGRKGADEIDIGVITLPDDGLANYDPNAGRAQKFTRKGRGSGPFSLAPYGNNAGPLLSVVLGHNAPVLSHGSPNYVPLGLGQPDNGSLINLKLPLNLLGGLDGPAQGAIWSLGPNNEMFAHYVNPDGSSSPVFLVTGGPCHHLICLSADINAFRQVYGDDTYDIHAFLTVA